MPINSLASFTPTIPNQDEAEASATPSANDATSSPSGECESAAPSGAQAAASGAPIAPVDKAGAHSSGQQGDAQKHGGGADSGNSLASLRYRAGIDSTMVSAKLADATQAHAQAQSQTQPQAKQTGRDTLSLSKGVAQAPKPASPPSAPAKTPSQQAKPSPNASQPGPVPLSTVTHPTPNTTGRTYTSDSRYAPGTTERIKVLGDKVAAVLAKPKGKITREETLNLLNDIIKVATDGKPLTTHEIMNVNSFVLAVIDRGYTDGVLTEAEVMNNKQFLSAALGSIAFSGGGIGAKSPGSILEGPVLPRTRSGVVAVKGSNAEAPGGTTKGGNVDNTLKPNGQAAGTGNKGTTPDNRTGATGAGGTGVRAEAAERKATEPHSSSTGKLIGSIDKLTAAEQKFVNELVASGKTVEIIPTNKGRTADFFIDGVRYELKTMSNVVNQTSDGLSSALSSTIMDARGQSGKIIIDARNQPGMTAKIAERGIRRAFGRDDQIRPKIQSVTVITPKGTVYIVKDKK